MPLSQPVISVIVPTRNRSSLLAHLLDSFGRVHYSDWELLVIDDGSTDDTAAVVEHFRAQGLPLRYVRQAWGRMGSARNRGIARAQGEIVAFTDDDCTVTPEWLTTIADAFSGQPDVLGVQGRTVTVRERMTPFTRQVEQLAGGQPYRTCNIAYRTHVVRALGGFDPDLIRGEDVVMGARILEQGPILFVPDMVVCHPPRPKEWADRAAWRTLLESETHFKSSYPQYAAGRSQTLSVQRANHVLSRLLLLPIRRYWRWHWVYAWDHPTQYARQIPHIIGEKLALLSLLPRFLSRWTQAVRDAQPGSAAAASTPIVPITEGGARPLISVVVPTRNRRDRLERLLVALDQQSYPHREIIVVDDASTDGTDGAVSGHEATLLRQERPGGSYSARNRGWRAAQGEIVAFTDDDCVPHRDWLAALVHTFKEEERTVGVQGVILPGPGEVTPFTHEIVQTEPGPPYRTANVAYRRAVLEQLGGFDEGLRWYGDNLFGYRARRIGPIAFAPDALVFHPPRPHEWRTVANWVARFEADAEHRRQLQELGVEPRVFSARALPLVLWVARPLIKQLRTHVRYSARHPLRYARDVVPMAREKTTMIRAMRLYWHGTLIPAAAETLASLPDEPCISVVIATRGRAAALDTLEALERQSWSARETVVVEHGSQALRDAAIEAGAHYLHLPEDATLGAVRQAGVDASHGDIVAFTDDDCLPDAEWLATIARGFRADPRLWGIQGCTVAASGAPDTYAIRVDGPNRLYRTCNIAYRKDAIGRAGGFNLGFVRWFEDTALGVRIEAHGPIGFERTMCVVHRAMPRLPLDRAAWQVLLRDERRLEQQYPEFYRAVRGPGFWPVVSGRWLIGAAVKAVWRATPAARRYPRAYVWLLQSLFRERLALLQALFS